MIFYGPMNFLASINHQSMSSNFQIDHLALILQICNEQPKVYSADERARKRGMEREEWKGWMFDF